MPETSDSLARLMVPVENEERRAAETNERLKRRYEDEGFGSIRRRPYKVLAHLTVRDIRGALDNDQSVLDEYWEREAHMERLRAKDEEQR